MKRFPFYFQFNQMDCGPTCLKMIFKHYGFDISIEYLRKICYVGRDGVSFANLIEAANSLGLKAVGIKIEFEVLQRLVPLPCIAHWNRRHLVVVYRITRRHVYVSDPAIGHVRYSHDEFKKCWLGFDGHLHEGMAIAFEKANISNSVYDRGKVSSRLYPILFSFLREHKPLLSSLFVGLVLVGGIQLFSPILSQLLFDQGVFNKNSDLIYLILTGQIVFFAGRVSIEVIRRWVLLYLSSAINVELISRFLKKLMKLSISFFEGRMIGDVMQRVDDHARIERFISSSTINMVFSFFGLIIFSFILFLFDVDIFFVFIIFSVLYVVYVTAFLRRRAVLDYKRFSQLSASNNNMLELLMGMHEIKLNNCEQFKYSEWSELQRGLFQNSLGSTKIQQYQEVGSSIINETKNILIVFLSAFAVLRGEMSFGTMLSIQYSIGALNAPINDLVVFLRELQDAKLSFDRVNDVHIVPDEEQEWGRSKGTLRNSDIIFDNVSFGYQGPNGGLAIREFNLVIPFGKTTAIVGESGSGKTTLLKLLLRFNEPLIGQIWLGNERFLDISQSEWRRRCGVVLQDGFLFSDSIEANIALSSMPEIDKRRLETAVEQSCLSDVIEDLPAGLQTKIGVNGIGLSQGQKQRVLIARAIYKNPDYIFLDEATSSLDARNERQLYHNFGRFCLGRTVVVVAHRLSTVRDADQIVVLKRGRILEIGPHQSLLEGRGEYFSLVSSQLDL